MPSTSKWEWSRLRTLCEREAGRVLRNPSDRDDAVQEALLRTWSQRAACRTPLDPDAWVRQIARREACRVAVRRRRDSDRRADRDAEPSVPDDTSASIDRLTLQSVLRGLPPRDRTLIALRYVADLTHAEVATALGIPVGTARVRVHRVRTRLAASMGVPVYSEATGASE